MYVRLFFIFILFFSSLSARAEIDPKFVKFCENAGNLQSIAGSMPNIFNGISPLPPFGGVTIGLISNSTALMDMCSFVIDFSRLEGSGKTLLTKNLLHKMTGDEFDEDFNMFDNSFNMLSSVYDFESGESRPGSMKSASSYNEMIRYGKDLNRYVARRQMSEADKRAEQNTAFVSEAQLVAQISARNANLKSALRCPAPNDGKDYGKMYDKDVAPKELQRTRAEEDEVFYREQLLKLGRFLNRGSLGGYQVFESNVEKLRNYGAILTPTVPEPTYTEETYKPTNLLDSEGHVIQKKVLLKKTYQSYTYSMNNNLFEQFQAQYGPEWSEIVQITYLSNVREYGILDPKTAVEAEFRDFNYECRENLLMRGYDPEAKDYNVVLQKKIETCRNNLKLDEKKVDNLLNYYVINYQNTLYLIKKLTAEIWTFESRYMNINRSSSSTVFNEEDVKCSDHLTPVQMQELSNKQEVVNSDLKEVIAKNYKKKTDLKSLNAKNMKQNNDELNQRMEKIKNKKKAQDSINDQYTPSLSPLNTGIRNK